MSFWSKLGASLGLLGKPMRIENKERKFGEAPFYIAVQVEDDEGDEEVLLFTDYEINNARDRARKNSEDVVAFLADHKVRDMVD